MVYLKLQPYKQLSVSMRKNLKLSTKYYDLFKFLRRIGVVAYKLELPPGSRIHPVFRVSLLRRQIGDGASAQPELPLVRNDEEKIMPMPQAVLDKRIRKGKGPLARIVSC